MSLFNNPTGMYFGTEERMTMIDIPQTGADVSSLGQSAEATLLNGGGYQRNSWDSHKVSQFSWADSSSKALVSLLQAYRNGSYGRGLLYFHDPMHYDTNLLPKRWADPSMAVNYEAEPLIPDANPTATPVAISPALYPSNAATYRLASGYSSQTNGSELFIPIPPGMSLLLGAVYSGSGTVYYRTPSGIVDLPPLSASAPTVINTVVRDQAWVRLGIRNTGATGSITILGMTARLGEVPTGEGIPFTFTNLATAPSFEAAGSAVLVRTNGCINPKPTLATGWSSSGSVTFTADGYTTTNASSVTPYVFSAAAAGGAVTGRIYAMSALIRCTTVAGSTATSLAIRPHRNTGNVYYTPDGGSVNVPIDGVQRLIQFYWTATVDIPEAEAFNLTAVANGGGGILSMDEVLIEEVPLKPVTFPLFFYGGGASPDVDGTTSWLNGTGAPSASRMTMLNAGVYTSSSSVNFVRSAQWSSEGSFSGRLIPSGTSMDTYAILRVLTAADAGKTFRISITARLTAPTLSDSAFSRSLFYTGTGGNIQGPKAPNVAGTSVIEMTVTTPANLTAGTIRFYHGGAYGDSDVWIDSLQISNDGYTGPAFTGRTPGAIWNGTPDASTSTITGTTPISGGLAEGPWHSGEGHSGSRFVGNPVVVEYNGVDGGQIGIAATFREVGAWV